MLFFSQVRITVLKFKSRLNLNKVTEPKLCRLKFKNIYIQPKETDRGEGARTLGDEPGGGSERGVWGGSDPPASRH